MPQRKPTYAIAMGLSGIVAILLGLLVFSLAGHNRFAALKVSKEDILQRAEAIYKRSRLVDLALEPTVSIDYDKDLLRYAQLYDHSNEYPDYSPVRVEVQYGDRVIVDVRENGIRIDSESSQQKWLQLQYDLNGLLRGFERDTGTATDSAQLSVEEALQVANQFLQNNFIQVQLGQENQLSRQVVKGLQTIVFHLDTPLEKHLQREYDVTLSGNQVSKFASKETVREEAVKPGPVARGVEVATGIAVGILWTILLILLFTQFVYRLRREEIEFRHGMWVGIFFGGVLWIAMAVIDFPNWQNLLIGAISGAFFGGLLLLCFSVTDACYRDYSPAKVALSDLFLQGHFRVRETGEALLNSLLIAGVSLLGLALLCSLAEAGGWSWFKPDHEGAFILGDMLKWFSSVAEWIPQALLVTLLGVAFPSVWLAHRLANRQLLQLLLTLVIAILGSAVIPYGPLYINVLVLLPLAWYWSNIALNKDLVTLFFSFLLAYALLQLSLLRLLPHGFGGLPALFALVLLIGIFIVGLLLCFSKRGIADFRNYVPPYVSRLAEKQRILNELEIARNIQTRFLPQRNPSVAGLDIASICRPAMEVGGDYYDFMYRDENLSVVVGDVSGKGISAAFYMTMTKGIVLTLAKTLHEPAKILSHLNEVFYENTPRNIFISLLYGVFDMREHKLHFARAGHNPLLVHKGKAGNLATLHPGGIAIGMDGGKVFNKVISGEVIDFEEGDIFIFYTDGISESMNANGEEFGEERLGRIIQQSSDGTAGELMESINQAIQLFSGEAPQHDDFTMVIVKIDSKQSAHDQ